MILEVFSNLNDSMILVGSTGLKKNKNLPGNLHWVCYKPTFESQDQNSSSDCGELAFTMLLSMAATKERFRFNLKV